MGILKNIVDPTAGSVGIHTGASPNSPLTQPDQYANGGYGAPASAPTSMGGYGQQGQPQGQASAAGSVPQGVYDAIGRHHGLRGLLQNMSDAYDDAHGQPGHFQALRDRQLIGSAMASYQTDPDGTIAKIASVNPQLADAFMTHRDNLAYKNMMGESLIGHRQSMDGKTNLQAQKLAIASAFAWAKGHSDDPSYQAGLPAMDAMLSKYGLDHTSIGLPDKYDKETWQTLGTDPYRVFNDTRNAVFKQENADANTTRAGAAVTAADTGQARQRTNEAESPSRIKKNNASADHTASLGNGPPLPGGAKPPAASPQGVNLQPPGSWNGGATKMTNKRTGATVHWDGSSWK